MVCVVGFLVAVAVAFVTSSAPFALRASDYTLGLAVIDAVWPGE